MRFFVVPSMVVSMALSSAGCGEPKVERVPVMGTVFIDGKPLEGGTIRFVPKTGRPASSTILSDGSFEVVNKNVDSLTEHGLLPGEYRVQVSSSEIVDDETIHWKAPQRYADFRTSGLEVVVEGPTKELKIELRSQTEGEEEAASTAPDETQVEGKEGEAEET